MRISDWSSDVCSSDLRVAAASSREAGRAGGADQLVQLRDPAALCRRKGSRRGAERPVRAASQTGGAPDALPRLRCRAGRDRRGDRSEEHTSELQSLMRISYALSCLNKTKQLPI